MGFSVTDQTLGLEISYQGPDLLKIDSLPICSYLSCELLLPISG